MQISKKVIERSLQKKGFIKKSSDHIFFYHEYKGKRTGAYTKVSYSAKKYKVYGVQLIKLMKRQLLLDSIQETKQLLQCPMDADEYINILREKGVIND